MLNPNANLKETTPLLSQNSQIQAVTSVVDILKTAEDAVIESDRLLKLKKYPEALEQAKVSINASRQAIIKLSSQIEEDQDSDADTNTLLILAKKHLKRAQDAEVAAQPILARTSLLVYRTLFDRNNGFIKTTPFVVAPNFPADGTSDILQRVYFTSRDFNTRTLTFFLFQSLCSMVAFYIVEATAKPPGQVFDIRYIVDQQANQNFSTLLQFKNFQYTGSLTFIFWTMAIPSILLSLTLGIALLSNDNIRDRTMGAYNATNSWRDAFKLYGWQGIEVFLACTFVNVMMLTMGEPLAPILETPVTVNVVKTAFPIGLDLLRNIAQKTFTATKEHCLPPAGKVSNSPA